MRPRYRLLLVLFASAVSSVVVAGEALPWEVWHDLRRLAVIPAGDQVALRSSHCLDGCGLDRHSQGDERFIRMDGVEGVIFEERGPGAIVRIWMTAGESGMSVPIDPATSIRFYFDGEAAPRIDLPLPALFDGSTPPFQRPLVGDRLVSSGGNFSYVPIAFASSCRVTLAGDLNQRLWFQLTFHRLAPEAAVASYTESEDLTPLSDLLSTDGDPWPAGSGLVESGTVTLQPQLPQLVWSDDDAATLTELAFDLPTADWPRTRATLTFDGLTTVNMPLSDLFAAGASLLVESLWLRSTPGGELRTFFPMPYRRAATLALTVDEGGSNVDVGFRLRREPGSPLAGSGYFAAALSVSDPSTVGFDHPLLVAPRPGKWVGLYAELQSVETPMKQYLEGDERVYVDGLRHPTLYGTGTEDFFNGGFYFDQGLFAQPLHGLLEQGVTAAGEHRTVAYRFLLTDAVPYARSIEAGLEGGNRADLRIRARTVAYHYVDLRPALSSVDRLDLGDPVSRAEHGYQASDGDETRLLDALFEGAPATALVAEGSYRTAGSAQFVLDAGGCVDGLRLRRLWDAGGEGQRFELSVGGASAGGSEFTLGNPSRRWAEIDFDLSPLDRIADGPLDFSIVVTPDNAQNEHSAFSYELLCRRARGSLFSDGFETGGLRAWSQVVR